MTELFQQLLDWVSLHPYWAGVVIFSVAMAESLAIVGLIVPGVVIMFGIGALIASGAIPFWPAMGWAVAGAILGDGLSFWLGRHFQHRLESLWPFRSHPQSLRRGVEFFHRYGGKSVAIGRFFGPVRAVIPLVAGMMGMSPPRFLLANVLSALVWAPAYLLPGMIFGASLELASEVAVRLVLLILLLAVIAWLIFHLVKWIFRLLQPHTSAWMQGLLNWSRVHPVMGEIAAALADPHHPEARGLSLLASLLLIMTALFALLMVNTLGGSALAGIDHTVLLGLQSLRTPWADHLMTFITRLADFSVLASISLGVLGYLYLRGHRRTLLYWLAALLFGLLASPLLKMGLQIPRPDVVMSPPDSYSFPSGHTLKAVVLYGFLSVILARPMGDRWRWLPYGIAGLVAGAVAFSRLYLGVHWLSDVLASATLGIAWLAALSMAYHRHTHIESRWQGLLATALLALVLSFATESWLRHQSVVARYQPAEQIQSLDMEQWWSGRESGLPTHRADTRERLDHPLNIQYAGDIAWLRGELENRGWREAEMLDWGNLLKLLSPGLALDQLPLLPQVHDGRHERLVLEKRLADGRRLVLRLWSAQRQLIPAESPLWIGNVTGLRQVRLLNMITFAETDSDYESPYRTLLPDLQQQLQGRTRETQGNLLLRMTLDPTRTPPQPGHSGTRERHHQGQS